MSQSTEIVRRQKPTAEAVLTRRIEAHAIAAQSQERLTSALLAVYARTEGLPLVPIRSWFFHGAPSPTPSLSGYLEHDYTSPAHVQREHLHEWARALGAEVKESRDYGSKVKLQATCLIEGTPVSVQVEIDHYCTCTGQCGGDR